MGLDCIYTNPYVKGGTNSHSFVCLPPSFNKTTSSVDYVTHVARYYPNIAFGFHGYKTEDLNKLKMASCSFTPIVSQYAQLLVYRSIK